MLDGTFIIIRFLGIVVGAIYDAMGSKINSLVHRYTYKEVAAPRNVVVIGASFAGYHAARVLANSLPTGYRVVVVEKSSHFQFTWVFPRFSVVSGHEHKAFIPYGPYFGKAPQGSWLMLQDTVAEVGKSTISLQSGEKLGYEYLVMATGSRAGAPSRLNTNEKEDGMDILRGLQGRICDANDFVVVGGGAAGVELASDAKGQYPQKNVTLIHSRKTLLNNFGTKLHDAALQALEGMGVRVVLGERVGPHAEGDLSVSLGSGEVIPCDLLVRISTRRNSRSWMLKYQRSDVQARRLRLISSRTCVRAPFLRSVDL